MRLSKPSIQTLLLITLFAVNINFAEAQFLNFQLPHHQKIATVVETHSTDRTSLDSASNPGGINQTNVTGVISKTKITWETRFEETNDAQITVTKQLTRAITDFDFGRGDEDKYDSANPFESTENGERSAMFFVKALNKPVVMLIPGNEGLKKTILKTAYAADTIWNSVYPIFDSLLYFNNLYFPSIIPANAKKNQTFESQVALNHKKVKNIFTVIDINQNAITLKFKNRSINTDTALMEKRKNSSSLGSFTKERNYVGTLIVDAHTLMIINEDYDHEVIEEIFNTKGGNHESKSYSATAIKNTVE